jgi:hypothetical protein
MYGCVGRVIWCVVGVVVSVGSMFRVIPPLRWEVWLY